MLEDYNDFNDGASKLMANNLRKIISEATKDKCEWSPKMKQEFSDVKVGDKVWDFISGWGAVIGKDPLSFKVNYGFYNKIYNYDGKIRSCINRTLFWDEVKITAPPKPKKLVTNSVTYCVKYLGQREVLVIFDDIKPTHGTKLNITISYQQEEC